MKKIFLFSGFLLVVQSNLSAQCLSQPTCPASPVTFCDVSTNDAQFWNDTSFYDPAVSSRDLGETPTDLSVQIMENCGTGYVAVTFVLLLDLDGNGSRETAVTNYPLPPSAETVHFGNAANPNYAGGIVQHFDLRPVPSNQKYGFTLEKTLQGDVVTARLRWATALAPNDYVLPQLPYGTHHIEWRFEKGYEVKTCGYDFVVKDCKAPTVSCLPGLSVNIMPTQMIQLWASDFLLGAQDNHTPANQLKYGIRRSGTGTGFPVDGQGNLIENIVFTCADLATQPVELWAKDLAGNADYCETYVIVQDNNGNCPEPGGTVFLCATNHCDGAVISEVNFDLSGSSPAVPPFHLFDLNSSDTGCVVVTNNSIPISSNVTITPNKDNNPLNGVSTYDLVLMSRHILGLEPLNSPYKMIAADVTRSGSITSFDIVELRRLILGFYQELPNNTSWRFVDKAFVFPNPNNPFQTVFPESKTFVMNPQSPINFDFVGIKIGDVNCSAIANFTGQTPEEEALVIPDQQLQANDIVEVPVRFAQANGHYGFQFGLQYDPNLIQVLEVMPALGSIDNFGVFPGRVNVSWSGAEPVISLPDEPVFRMRIKALAPLHLADAFGLDKALHAEAYADNADRADLHLQFAATEPGAAQEIFAPQPNPTAAGVRIPLRLEQPATVAVEILDATGRLIYRQEQMSSVGAQWLEIPASAFPQVGVYLWRVLAGEAVGSGKIVKQ